REAGRHVAERVVGRGLVGNDVDGKVARGQLRDDIGRVAKQTDRQRAPGLLRVGGEPQRVLEVVGADVQVAVVQAALDVVRVDLDADRDAAVQGHGERLCATHPTQAG